MKRSGRRPLFPLILLLGLAAIAPSGRGDTALVLRGDASAFAARNFDGLSGAGYLFINRRGVAKAALVAGPGEPLRWTSRYGSVSLTPIGLEFPLAGINEAGLCIQALPGPAGFSPPPQGRPVVNELQWLQYHLDRHRSVADVLKTRGAPGIAPLLMQVHYLVADRKGNAAIVEFAGGRQINRAGRNPPELVLTEAGYAESLKALEERRGFGGEAGIPNGPDPVARFARAASMLRDLTAPGARSGIDDSFLALNSAAGPETQWNLVFHLPGRRIFWKTKTRRRFKIVSLESLDFTGSSPAFMLPVDGEAAGGLNDAFIAFDPALNRALVETVFTRFPDLRPPVGLSEAEIIRLIAAPQIAAEPGRRQEAERARSDPQQLQFLRMRMLPPEVRR